MITTAGEIYFIGELDLKTQKKSDYFKIGIVRELEGRSSVNRLSEHQTGNPRRLTIEATVSTKAVEAVETTLHHLYAKHRVNGEWMRFTKEELNAAVDKAEELAKEMEKHVPDSEVVASITSLISNGQVIQATQEALRFYSDYQDNKLIYDACEEVISQYKGMLRVSIASGADTSSRASVQKRAGALRFNEKLFAEKYPDLFKQYSESKTQVTGRFSVAKAKDWKHSLNDVNPEIDEIINEFMEKMDIDVIDEELEFMLHDQFLEIVGFQKFAEWEMEKAETKLRILTNTNDGIEGVTSWKRTEISKTTLDKATLKVEQPDAYADCQERGADTEALIVEAKAGYKM